MRIDLGPEVALLLRAIRTRASSRLRGPCRPADGLHDRTVQRIERYQDLMVFGRVPASARSGGKPGYQLTEREGLLCTELTRGQSRAFATNGYKG